MNPPTRQNHSSAAKSGITCGIGWRHPHYGELLESTPDLGFIEVHSENFFAEGGATLAVLWQAREHYPVSLHGVGLSLGSACGIDAWHLDQLARLVAFIDPIRVSDHACFAMTRTRPSSSCGGVRSTSPWAALVRRARASSSKASLRTNTARSPVLDIRQSAGQSLPLSGARQVISMRGTLVRPVHRDRTTRFPRTSSNSPWCRNG